MTQKNGFVDTWIVQRYVIYFDRRNLSAFFLVNKYNLTILNNFNRYYLFLIHHYYRNIFMYFKQNETTRKNTHCELGRMKLLEIF